MFSLIKKRRDMGFLFASVFISLLGTWFTYMLLVVQIFNKTQDERTTMIVVGAQAVAALIGGQVAGVYIENKNPKKVLIVSDWISAVIIASVFFVPANVYIYSFFGFLIAFVNAFRSPSFQKYLVASINEDDLMQANSSFQMISELVKIFGPAIAVSVLALLPSAHENYGFLIDAASYVIAALLLFRLADVKGAKEIENKGSKKEKFIQKWSGGLTPLKDPVVLNVFVIFLLILFSIGGADVVFTSHVSEAGLNSYNVGYIIGAIGLGILITAMFGAKYVKNWPLSVQLGISSLLLGLCYSLIGWSSNLYAMIAAALLMGVFNSIYNMSSSTFWQKRVPYNQLGRFLSFSSSIFAIATLIGMAANAYISSLFTAGFNIILCGIIIALAGIILTVNITIVHRRQSVNKNHKETA